MAAAANVSFDVLLGGKITPEALKALKDMEAKLKQFGASTRSRFRSGIAVTGRDGRRL